MFRTRAWIMFLFSFLSVGAGYAQDASVDASHGDVIGEIRFEGNNVTRAELMRQEMTLHAGDVPTDEAVEKDRQSIMNLGLFVSVEARLEQSGAGTQTLVMKVDEKHYVLPIPKIDRDVDGNVRAGVQLRLDNIQGLNQRVKINFQEQNQSHPNGRAKLFDANYDYPRVLGSAYSFNAGVSDKVSPAVVREELGDGTYVSHQQGLHFGVSRLLIREGPTWGWEGGVGAVYAKENIDDREGNTAAVTDQRRVGLELSVANTRVNDFLYSREGRDYGAGVEFGFPQIGSQGAYTRTNLYWRYFLPFSARAHTMLAAQLKMGFSSGYLFGSEYAYTIGGGNSLRGFPADSFGGGTYLTSNVELHSPLMAQHPALVGLAFVDFGNAYPDGNDINLRDFHSSAGLGLRFKLKTFVKIDLRLDYAHAFDNGEYKILAGTHEAF